MTRHARPLVVLLALAALTGCGGRKIYPVSGKVEYKDGTAAADLAGYKVELESIDGTIDGRKVSAEGTIGPDATFTITTLKKDDGALLGKHRVLIAPPVPVGDTPSRPYAVDPRYISYEQSGLTATVEAKSNTITLTIERRKR